MQDLSALGTWGCPFYRVPTTQSKISVADLEVPGSEPFRARLLHDPGPAPHRGTPKCPGLPMHDLPISLQGLREYMCVLGEFTQDSSYPLQVLDPLHV